MEISTLVGEASLCLLVQSHQITILVGSLPLPSGIQKSDGKITMLFSWVKQLEIDWAMASIANCWFNHFPSLFHVFQQQPFVCIVGFNSCSLLDHQSTTAGRQHWRRIAMVSYSRRKKLYFNDIEPPKNWDIYIIGFNHQPW